MTKAYITNLGNAIVHLKRAHGALTAAKRSLDSIPMESEVENVEVELTEFETQISSLAVVHKYWVKKDSES